MKKIFLTLTTALIATSCAYDNKGDDAQREANRIYEESLAKCNELKGTYTGTLQSAEGLSDMDASIYCVVSPASQTDKNNTTIFQVVPEIYLKRRDLPIPSILQILDQGFGIGMKPKSSGGGAPGGGAPGGGAPTSNESVSVGSDAPAGSLLASIRFDSFKSFNGFRTGNEIRGELRTDRPVGILTLTKKSAEVEAQDLLSLNEKIESELIKILSPYMKTYHGCLFLGNVSGEPSLDSSDAKRLPINILVRMEIVDSNFQGKTMKAIRTRFYRSDLPGNPSLANLWMRTNLRWNRVDGKQFLYVTLEAVSTPQNINYIPILDGTLIVPVEELKEVNSKHWFFGEFESKSEFGQFRLFRQDEKIKDCRVYKNQLKP